MSCTVCDHPPDLEPPASPQIAPEVSPHSHAVGVLLAGSEATEYTELLLAIARASHNEGLSVTVAGVDPQEGAGAYEAPLRRFAKLGVDGLVVVSPMEGSADALSDLISGTPTLVTGINPADWPSFTTVVLDDFQGGYQAAAHLISLGHREFAHVSGDQRSFRARERQRGWLAGLQDAEIGPGTLIEGGWTADGGNRAGSELLRNRLPTAVFAANDQLALGLISALNDGGISVPRAVSVVGFGGQEGSAFFRPPLTTIRPDQDLLGQTCIDTLKDLMLGGDRADRLVPAALVARSSTTRPRRNGK